MPALEVCGSRWLVGSDDFALPALVAILVRFPCVGLTVGVLIYLFFGPSECLNEDFLPELVPPLVYGSLFGFCLILCMGIFNEAIIFSVSIRANIVDPDRKRKGVIVWLIVRAVLIIIEVATSLLCTVAVFGPAPFAAGALVCQEYHDGPLLFARIVVVCMLVIEVVYILGFAVFVDPCGCFCSPSILPSLEDIDDYVKKTPAELKNSENEYAKNSRLGHLHSNHVSYRDTLRKVRGILCCFNANGNRSRQTAMQEMALALHTLFNNADYVPSDLVAGLVLLSRQQKDKKKKCEHHNGSDAFKCPCLHVGLRKITFDHMPKTHLPKHFSVKDLPPPKGFDPTDPREQLLLDDLIHYMRYSMGIYGWTLHVFDNLLCGPCQIMAATCCRCKFRRWHPLAQTDPDLKHPRVVNDDCCMSGLATMQINSDLEDQHVIYMSYENEVFQAPFSVCIDDKMEAVVVTIRGTLSIQDAMTDLSISMVDVEPQYRNKHVEGKQCMHKGMYITTKHIFDSLVSKKLLEHAFSKYPGYRLIITGHSLGGGVASMLSMMLEPYYPDLYCYAFSPPGCIFSFPLSLYSEKFTRVVVLGNDMIPRITFRSLFYLKRQTEFLIKTCQYSKFQILFRPRFFDSLPYGVRNCLFNDKKDPIFDPHPLDEELKARLHYAEEGKNSLDGLVSSLISTQKAVKKWRRSSRIREGNLHAFVAGVEEEKLIASFPPRNVLHIPIKQSKMPWLFRYCFPDQLSLNHVNGEDICVIIVDRGMIQDHLPNNVLAALIRCKKEMVGSQYRAEEIRALRRREKERVQELIAQRTPVDVQPIKESSLTTVPAKSGAEPVLDNDTKTFKFQSDSDNSTEDKVTVVTIEPTKNSFASLPEDKVTIQPTKDSPASLSDDVVTTEPTKDLPISLSEDIVTVIVPIEPTKDSPEFLSDNVTVVPIEPTKSSSASLPDNVTVVPVKPTEDSSESFQKDVVTMEPTKDSPASLPGDVVTIEPTIDSSLPNNVTVVPTEPTKDSPTFLPEDIVTVEPIKDSPASLPGDVVTIEPIIDSSLPNNVTVVHIERSIESTTSLPEDIVTVEPTKDSPPSLPNNVVAIEPTKNSSFTSLPDNVQKNWSTAEKYVVPLESS